jgi:hypothetical protein
MDKNNNFNIRGINGTQFYDDQNKKLLISK